MSMLSANVIDFVLERLLKRTIDDLGEQLYALTCIALGVPTTMREKEEAASFLLSIVVGRTGRYTPADARTVAWDETTSVGDPDEDSDWAWSSDWHTWPTIDTYDNRVALVKRDGSVTADIPRALYKALKSVKDAIEAAKYAVTGRTVRSGDVVECLKTIQRTFGVTLQDAGVALGCLKIGLATVEGGRDE